jgi:hypothetical protein
MPPSTPPELIGGIEFAIVKFFRMTRDENRQMGHGYVLDTEGLITDRPEIKFYMNKAAIPAINYHCPGLNLVRRGFGTILDLRPPLTGERIAYIRQAPPLNTDIAAVWTYERLWKIWQKGYIALKKSGGIPTVPPFAPPEFLIGSAPLMARLTIPVPQTTKPGPRHPQEGSSPCTSSMRSARSSGMPHGFARSGGS